MNIIKDLSIRYKLLLSFLLMAILLIPISLYMLKTTNNVQKSLISLTDATFPRVHSLFQMNMKAIEVTSLIGSLHSHVAYTQSQITDRKNELLAKLEDINKWYKVYNSHAYTTNTPVHKEFTVALDRVIFTALQAFSVLENKPEVQQIQEATSLLEKSQNELTAIIKDSLKEENFNLEELKHNTIDVTDKLFKISLFMNLLILVTAILLSILLSRIIAQPIIHLRNFSQNISPDNLDETFPVTSKDEIGQLGNSINHMLNELAHAKSRLIDVSRQAGKAEIATSILHNVGNLLNSIVASTTYIKNVNSNSKIHQLSRTLELIRNYQGNLDEYLRNDEKGKLLISFLVQLDNQLKLERSSIENEVMQLNKYLEDVKSVVDSQQQFARSSDVTEKFLLHDIVDEAISYNNKIAKCHLKLDRDYSEEIVVNSVKSKLQQILLNLLKNAVESLNESKKVDKILKVAIHRRDDKAEVVIEDNGLGVHEDHLTKIFEFGFTTKHDGHGYGLHSSCLLAKELGGNLNVTSKGEGRGAIFTLDFKIKLQQEHKSESHHPTKESITET